MAIVKIIVQPVRDSKPSDFVVVIADVMMDEHWQQPQQRQQHSLQLAFDANAFGNSKENHLSLCFVG